jgi:hypothetical protein
MQHVSKNSVIIFADKIPETQSLGSNGTCCLYVGQLIAKGCQRNLLCPEHNRFL